ncbi:hypothetical protein H5410_005895 [Solanum commersonii]|uniref:Uncharacterized protein n=1 Tax=Solanum commersonii TaxID=4109 RepID=A0A9J6A7V4_SOLCO|nr:hypothetical protein H5410_005895 [Solanum commersonii]
MLWSIYITIEENKCVENQPKVAEHGLHMNMLKSTIYPVNEVINLEELADIMGCNIGSFPFTYLGLPLADQYKSTEI